MLHKWDVLLSQDISGLTEYTFPECSDLSLSLKSVSPKGTCLFAAKKVVPGETLFVNPSVAISVIGNNRNYICKKCLMRIKKSAKVREDCVFDTFCSTECLRDADNYLNISGHILSGIFKRDYSYKVVDFKTFHVLAMNFLYEFFAATHPQEIVNFHRVMELESHIKLEVTDSLISAEAEWLYNEINLHAPFIYFSIALKGIQWDSRMMYRLFKIIKYNAQPFPVHGIKDVQILCLIAATARINHSCSPNSTLQYIVEKSTVLSNRSINNNNHYNNINNKSHRIIAKVVALRDIAINEEITMTYLSQLCSSVTTRQELLQQGFAFLCHCDRCTYEEEAEKEKSMQLSGSVSRNTNDMNVTASNIIKQHHLLDDRINRLLLNMQQQQQSTPDRHANTIELQLLSDLVEERLLLVYTYHKSNYINNNSNNNMNSRFSSTAHDAALYIMQQSLQILQPLQQQHQQHQLVSKASSGGSMRISLDSNKTGVIHAMTRLLLIIVRMSLALSQSWIQARCANLLPRIEFTVNGAAHCMNLCNYRDENTSSTTSSSSNGSNIDSEPRTTTVAAATSIDIWISAMSHELSQCILILETVYNCKNNYNSSSSSSTTQGKEQCVISTVDVSADYLQILYKKAVLLKRKLTHKTV